MPQNMKQVRYLPYDVREAAKARIRYYLDCCDDIICAVSGGKDSMVCLYLMEEIWEELGRTDKIKVVFYDEEFIPDPVIDFMQGLWKSGKYEMYYICVPLKSQMQIMEVVQRYIQWDPDREGNYIRPKPEGAITQIAGMPKETVWSQYDIQRPMCDDLWPNQRIGCITGVRAAESLRRLQSVLGCIQEPHVAGIASKHPTLRPIYDWSEDDVFRYFYDTKKPYCTIYDDQTWTRMEMRVASSLSAEGSNTFHRFQQMFPTYWEQMMRVFPELKTHARYYREMDMHQLIDNYPHTFDGIRQYIQECFDSGRMDEDFYNINMKGLEDAERRRNNNIAQGKHLPFGAFPIRHLWAQALGGSFRRGVAQQLPFEYKKSYFEFEGLDHLWPEHEARQNAKDEARQVAEKEKAELAMAAADEGGGRE